MAGSGDIYKDDSSMFSPYIFWHNKHFKNTSVQNLAVLICSAKTLI